MTKTRLLMALCIAVGVAAPALAATGEVPCPDDPEYPNGIARLESVFKEVRYWRRGEMPDFAPAPRGLILCRYDTVITGKRGRTRLRFFDRDENSGPSVVNVGSGTHIRVRDFHYTKPGRDAGVIEVILGTIRSFMKHESGESGFSVRTGTSVCGSRGTTYFVEVPKERPETTTVVKEGLVACEAVGMPGETLVGAGQGVSIGFEGAGKVFEVDEADLAKLEARVDAYDGWTPASELGPDPAALTGFPLPGPGDLPVGCRAPVQVGASIPTSKYKYCDTKADVVFSGCAVAFCVTEAQTREMLRERPSLVFEKLESTCRPACDESAGFGWLDFAGHGGFCGKCDDGLRWHRGLGCCR